MKRAVWSLLLVTLLLATVSARAEDLRGTNEIFNRVGFDQNLGRQLPLDLEFRDHEDQTHRLGDYFGSVPVIITPVYYRCPMLCTLITEGLVKALKLVKLEPGRDFRIVTFTINPDETAEDARGKRQRTLEKYDRPGAKEGWTFLTGSEESIHALTNEIGFKYYRDDSTGEFAHAAGIVIATPEGRLSHYFYGIDYSPKDLRFGLIEASGNAIGSAIDQLLLLCYHYDPVTGKYGIVINNSLRAAGIATVVLLFGAIFHMLHTEKKEHLKRLNQES